MRSTPFRVLIAGGGVAAAEAALALHDLAPAGTEVTLVSPTRELDVRALLPARIFGRARAQRLPLATIAEAAGAQVVEAEVVGVDTAARTVKLDDNRRLPYDALLVAVGASQETAVEHATTFHTSTAGETIAGLRADLEEGYANDVAVVVPPGASWTLPAYELALLLRGTLQAMCRDAARVHVVSPERTPLAMFGARASNAVADELRAAGVTWRHADRVAVRRGHRAFVALDGGQELAVDRVVAMPAAAPRSIPGLPEGFLRVDQTGRVTGLDGVWAAGDGTASLVKQGGLAAQQATAAATDFARAAGADLAPAPFRPVLRAVLVLPGGRRWLRRDVATDDLGEASDTPLWQPGGKIAAARLARLLDDAGLPQGPGGRSFSHDPEVLA